MAEFVVRLDEQPTLELDTLDIGVVENVINFDITGTIRDFDDELLAKLTETRRRPTEIHFTTDSALKKSTIHRDLSRTKNTDHMLTPILGS